jgi:type IV pilus assembly protein PilV
MKASSMSRGSINREKGFSLIEILVSIVVFGIGLLGAAGLQLATMRSNQFTAQASVATQLVRDYEEITQMLRSADLSTSEGSTVLSSLDTNTADTTTVNCPSSGAACTPSELAAFMLKEWKTRVTTELPGGRAVICRDSAPKDTSGTGSGLYHWTCDNQGDMLMVKIGWAGKADKADKTQQIIAAENRPRIVMTVFGNQKDFTD